MKILDQIVLFKTNNLFELFEKEWGYVKLNFIWKFRLEYEYVSDHIYLCNCA